jgi:hypothetical protein
LSQGHAVMLRLLTEAVGGTATEGFDTADLQEARTFLETPVSPYAQATC